jgi:hypothetical protein
MKLAQVEQIGGSSVAQEHGGRHGTCSVQRQKRHFFCIFLLVVEGGLRVGGTVAAVGPDFRGFGWVNLDTRA